MAIINLTHLGTPEEFRIQGAEASKKVIGRQRRQNLKLVVEP
jgi:hypothetical protein